MAAPGLQLKIDAHQIAAIGKRFENAKAKMPSAISQAVSTIGPVALTAMKHALPGQTGLKSKVIDKALKGKRIGSAYVIKSHGGNIRLKYFGARETSKGVTAAPWNHRELYAETFIMAGWWPNRVKPVAGGQVLRRVGQSKLPVEVVRSGLYIAEEMVKGASAAAFYNTVTAMLPAIVSGIISGAIAPAQSTAEKQMQLAAARKINEELAHVSLNDTIPF